MIFSSFLLNQTSLFPAQTVRLLWDLGISPPTCTRSPERGIALLHASVVFFREARSPTPQPPRDG